MALMRPAASSFHAANISRCEPSVIWAWFQTMGLMRSRAVASVTTKTS